MRRREDGKKMEGRATNALRRVGMRVETRKAKRAVCRAERVLARPPTPWVRSARRGTEMLVMPITIEDCRLGSFEENSV